jgi:hypothetical protein
VKYTTANLIDYLKSKGFKLTHATTNEFGFIKYYGPDLRERTFNVKDCPHYKITVRHVPVDARMMLVAREVTGVRFNGPVYNMTTQKFGSSLRKLGEWSTLKGAVDGLQKFIEVQQLPLRMF